MKQFTFTLMALGLIAGILMLSQPAGEEASFKTSGAGKSLDAWAFARSYPQGEIPSQAYEKAHAFRARQELSSRSNISDWEAMGPKNIGGRTLCLAFNPLNNNTLYAGSAGGGLWVSHTAGTGVDAWEQIETGFPVLGVGAIAIHPNDSNIIYIGTGEVYWYQNPAPGVADRLTRGTYGIGILKSTDAGQTWNQVLAWDETDLRGVQDLLINPHRPSTIYAATSEGLYRSTDAGLSWNVIHAVEMAVDIEIDRRDTSKIYVTHGSFFSNNSGIYRSTDGGGSFTKLGGGLPAAYTGKALLSLGPQQPNTLYASIADYNTNDPNANLLGLYRSFNGGDSWTQVNNEDVARWQGWYSHDVAIDPTNGNTLLWAGIDCWKSTNGGLSITQKSVWWKWDFGTPPVGGPEGPPDYMHGDIHAIYFHPSNPNRVFFACDGGIFESTDKGETFNGRNGGYQTQQFYANFGNSTTDSSLAIGGMQDNATAIYRGGDAWERHIGGDGLCGAIHPGNDQIIYGSFQYLGMRRSDDGGGNFTDIEPPDDPGDNTNFAGPYELAPSNPAIVYAGRNYLYKSTNGGDSWTRSSNSPPDGANPILTIAVSETDADLLYVGTSALDHSPTRIFKSANGGTSWTDLTGNLPDRLPMDIAIHPTNHDLVWVAFAGFGSHHIYKSTNGGQSWNASDQGLPDLPVSTLVIDPLLPNHIYAGNDHGVYFSYDGGQSWSPFCSGLPDVVLTMHLSISPANRKLRVATHGNGVYQTPLFELGTSLAQQADIGGNLGQNFPNPVRDITRIPFDIDKAQRLRLVLLDASGRELRSLMPRQWVEGKQIVETDLSDLPAGLYFYRLMGEDGSLTQKLIKY